MDTRSPTWTLLHDTQQEALLMGSEITVVQLPSTPLTYWACLREPQHRASEVAESRRLILRVRWAPHLAHEGWLIVSNASGQGEQLRSLGFAQGGLMDGIPLLPQVQRGHNGNVITLTHPLPPLATNPCRV